jgi:hypothetical protein
LFRWIKEDEKKETSYCALDPGKSHGDDYSHRWGYIFNNITYFERAMTAMRRAGFVEKQVSIEGNKLYYAKGPDNGPSLLLIQGQAADWENCAKVYLDLTTYDHIFAVDCNGHGGSVRVPEKYSNSVLGADIAMFVEEVIGCLVVEVREGLITFDLILLQAYPGYARLYKDRISA